LRPQAGGFFLFRILNVGRTFEFYPGLAYLPVNGQAEGQLVIDNGSGDKTGVLAGVIVAEDELPTPVVFEGRVLGIDDNGTRDGIRPLLGGLRAADNLHLFYVPQPCRPKDQFVECEGPAVDLDRDPRPGAAVEGNVTGSWSCAVDASDGGS